MLTRDRLGAFVAVLFGTGIVALNLTLLTSARPEVPARYAAISVAVLSPAVQTPADPFPESRPWSSGDATALAARLATVPGVTAAVVDRRFYAQPVPGGKVVPMVQEAHGWSSAALAPDPLIAGRPARADHEVVIGRSMGVPAGGTITLLTATGPTAWNVTGLIAADRLYVADSVAEVLAPGVRTIALTGSPDPARVSAAAAGAQVLHGGELGRLEPRSDARTRWIGMQVISAMTALSVFAAVFVIASTFALSVHQRRREMGLLRAIGATPAQVRRAVRREAAAVGAAAGVVGAALGLLAAPAVGRVLVDAGFEPASFRVGVHPLPVLVGLLTGPVVAVVGSLAAARRAARVGPIEALRTAEVETRPMTRLRWITGLAFVGLAAGCAALATTTDDAADLGTCVLLGAMALVVAATALAPAAVPPIVRVLLRPARGPIGTVMLQSALTGARRTASTAAPVLLTIAFAVFIAGQVRTSTNAYAERRADRIAAGRVLVPDGTPGLGDAAAPSAPLTTPVYVAGTVVTALGDKTPAPGDVVISQSRAAQQQLGIGNTIEVTFADGVRTSLRVAGTTPDGPEMQLNRTTVRHHDPSALADAQPLPAVPSSDGPAVLGAKAVSVADYARRADAEEDRLVWIFTMLLIVVSVGYGALAVANTLVMATARRMPDYRLLRLAGATPRQVLLAVAGESALAVVVGAVLGLSAAILALWGATAGLRAQTGGAVPLAVPWTIAAGSVGACLMLALAGSVLPARAGLLGPVREAS